MCKQAPFFIMKNLILILLLSSSLLAFGQYKSEIKTTYANSTFTTNASIMVACDSKTAVNTIEDFIAQFVGDPNRLFEWALKGVGKSDDESHNEVLLILKEADYDKLTGKSRLIIDVDVAGVMNLKDQVVESKITEVFENDGGYRVHVDVFYSNSLLKKADGIFFVKPISETKTELRVQFNIRFGWFFNIFITQKRYRNLFEWRCDGFMVNMKNEMERRYSKKVGKK